MDSSKVVPDRPQPPMIIGRWSDRRSRVLMSFWASSQSLVRVFSKISSKSTSFVASF